jgi:hypothetical protein
MLKSSSKRLKEPFNPALDAPVALTPDQIEKVGGGFASAALVRGGDGGATTGAVPPTWPIKLSVAS